MLKPKKINKIYRNVDKNILFSIFLTRPLPDQIDQQDHDYQQR